MSIFSSGYDHYLFILQKVQIAVVWQHMGFAAEVSHMGNSQADVSALFFIKLKIFLLNRKDT